MNERTPVAELTPSGRRALKARAHPLVPVVLVGDKGLTGAVLAEIERAVAAHELIKIRVQAGRADREAILREICARASASAVQHIGKVLVVYREKPPEARKPKIRKSRPKAADRGRPPRKVGAVRAPTGTGRPVSRTASPRRAPARPPGRRRTSR